MAPDPLVSVPLAELIAQPTMPSDVLTYRYLPEGSAARAALSEPRGNQVRL